MAYIPVNPERRDPGYFKKKSEIGLSNVDNMSVAEIVNSISDEVKILNNKKKLSSKISAKGEFYGGLVKTAPGNSHAEFTIGLFDSLIPNKELASIHVDFVFSCTSTDTLGHVNYTIGCPEESIYLKNLYIVFSQIQDQLYVSLHSPLFPERTSQAYFNIVGVNLIDWTEGLEKLDVSKDISGIVKGHEIARIRLTGSCSTVGSDSADSLSVYGERGNKVSLDSISSLEGLDYPSINGVPFIGKKDLSIGGEEVGRHITVPAYHKDSTLEGSGAHDWEVLSDIKKINLSKSTTEVTPAKSSKMPNNDDNGYGLVRPSRYKLLSSSSVNFENVKSWLNYLGDDTDVITVGAFREYMSYILKLLSPEETVETYYLHLENTEDLFKYVASGTSTFNIPVHSYVKSGSTKTISPITVSSSQSWLTYSAPEEINGVWSVNFSVKANQTEEDRTAVITITQGASGQTIQINVTQSLFVIRYGLLFNSTPIFEDTGYSIGQWGNGGVTSESYTLTPIKSDNVDPRGYKEITPYPELDFSNINSWISGYISNRKLFLTVEANYMSSVRTGTIYIGVMENSGEEFKYIPIRCSQASTSSYLNIDDDTDESSVVLCNVGKDQTTKRYQISSNYSWYVNENSVPSWIELSGYNGERPSGSSYLTLTISENTTKDQRESTIEIVNNGGTHRYIKVVQSSRSVYIDVEGFDGDAYLCFSSELSSETITLNSNLYWFVDQCPSWLNMDYLEGGAPGVVSGSERLLQCNSEESTPDTLSLSYYDEESETIRSLRKIKILPSVPAFSGKSYYVLPRIPETINVTSEGGPVTVKAYSNVKYRIHFLDRQGPLGPIPDHLRMIKDYDESTGIISEDPKNYPSKTSLTFTMEKNYSPYSRSLRFILIPDSAKESSIDETQYPIYTIVQEGNKSITAITYSTSVTKKTSAIPSLYVYRYTGVTTNTKPSATTPRQVADTVYESFSAKAGDVVMIHRKDSSTSPYLYKTTKKTSVLGDTIKPLGHLVTWDETLGWYIVKENGYYFTTTGEAEVITPSDSITCPSEKTKFYITLLSSKTNKWDLYNDDLPSWISLEKITGSLTCDKFEVIIDENSGSEDRNCVLQFYVDLIYRSLVSFTVQQTGVEITKGSDVCTEVLPVVSSGKTAFTYEAFDLGLTALVGYSTSVTVNGSTHSYTYSEYKDSGISFSVVADDDVYITEDAYGKPKLVAPENTSEDPRTIKVVATYSGKTGELILLQGSRRAVQFYTYEDLSIVPDLIDNVIPMGISKFGFKIQGTPILKTLYLETGEIFESRGEEGRIRFPYNLDNITINDCGLSLLTPETFGYTGTITGDASILYPVTEYTTTGESKKYIQTDWVTLNLGTENGLITVGNTVISGSKSGQVLSNKISFSKYSGIKLSRIDSSSDTQLYLDSSINGSLGLTGPTTLKVSLIKSLTDYLENKIITLIVTDPSDETSEILKYIHFRYIRALPEIRCLLSSTTYNNSSPQTTAKISTSSNIGYTTSAISNNIDGVSIKNGVLSTSSAKLEESNVIEFASSVQPLRKWYKAYATETIIIEDSENYGLTKEIPLVLKRGENSTPGFKITIGDEVIASFSDSTSNTSYDLILPYTGGEETIDVLCYDSYTAELSYSNGVTLTDGRPWIAKQVGSLREHSLTVSCSLVNNGTNNALRGTLEIESSTRSFTINIYQSSKDGVATITSPSTKILIYSENDMEAVTFSHLYPGWQIVQTDIPIITSREIMYPSFNNKGYNSAYGSGGNSGSTFTNGDGTSTVKLTYSGLLPESNINTSLSLKSVKECVEELTGYTTPGVFGIKNAPVDTLQVSSDTVKVTDSFKIMVKPDNPDFKVYQDFNNSLHIPYEVSSLTVHNEVIYDPLTQTGRTSKTLRFYVGSDILERTNRIIGSTITFNGESLGVYNLNTIYSKIFQPISIRYVYGTGSVEDGSYVENWKTIKVYDATSYKKINGKFYAYYEVPIGTNILSAISGNSLFTMEMFTVDSKYYQADKAKSIVLPLVDDNNPS